VQRFTLERRSKILRTVRDFFDALGFIEVETPVRIPAPAQETHIDAPPSGRAWLRASPELHMKRLLTEGFEKIYQIGPCFRSGECGRRHNPEFTMLEWYRTGADYLDILADTEALVSAVFMALFEKTTLSYRGATIQLAGPWTRLTVSDAYRRWAGWDPSQHWDADRFDTDMIARIEPALPRATPCVLIDYPAPAASLARLKPGDARVAERWEVYIAGLKSRTPTASCATAPRSARGSMKPRANAKRWGRTFIRWTSPS
jgi:lysyl-tRNA synthetase class 2